MPVNRNYLEEVEQAFLDVLALPTPQEQEAFLDQLEVTQSALASEVRMLLSLQEEAEDIFEPEGRNRISLLLTTLGEAKRLESKEELLAFLAETSPLSTESSDFIAAIRGYFLKELVCTGPNGFVFQGWDPVMKRAVAIKVLAPSISNDPDRRTTFLREARLAGSVQDQNVCTIYHVSSESGSSLVFYVSEWVDGESMEQWLQRKPKCPSRQSMLYLAKIIRGVSAIHSTGILHRDLKPGNVMLYRVEEDLRIIDFGLAQDTGRELVEDLPAGTPMYMSPEQFSGQAISRQSDLFALACIASVLTTGIHPYDSRSISELSRNLLKRGPDLSQSCFQENARLKSVLQKAVAMNPEDRFSTSEAFGNAWFSALGPAWSSLWFGEETPSDRQRGWLAKANWVAASLALVLALLGWGWLTSGSTNEGESQYLGVPSARKSGKWLNGSEYENYLGMKIKVFPSPAGLIEQWPPVVDHPGLFDRLGWMNYERNLAVGQHLVTQRQYLEVMGALPDKSSGDKNLDEPIGNVTYSEALAFCHKLSSMDPDGLRYHVVNENGLAYATFGFPLLSGDSDIESLTETFKGLNRGDAAGRYLFGIQDVFTEWWEWSEESPYKPPKLDGIVSYRNYAEVSCMPFYDIMNGGSSDYFVHAHDMNYGMNDHYHASENLELKLEEDGHTSYLKPIEPDNRAWISYRYQFDNPIKTATVIQPLSFYLEQASGGVRLRFRRPADPSPLEDCSWISLSDVSGLYMPKDREKRKIDLTKILDGAVEVEIEYWIRIEQEPIYYAQIGRTLKGDKSHHAFQFEAVLKGGRGESMRQTASLPASYRHPKIGFRVGVHGLAEHANLQESGVEQE